jgi:endonuclease YncB( thermonuclease family)
VIDGDTLDGEWRIWADTHRTGRLRLLGVNTPELHPRTGTTAEREAEKAAALAAKAYVETTLAGAKAVTMTTDWAADSFGRILAGVLYRDAAGVEHDLAQDLLSTGHARPFEE